MNRDAVRQNAAWARVNLGMTAKEFYSLTPAEFDRIWKAFEAKRKRDDSWLAKICWVVATSAGVRLRKPGTKAKPDPLALPVDFYAPWYVHPKEKKAKRSDPMKSILALVGKDRIVDNRKDKTKKLY